MTLSPPASCRRLRLLRITPLFSTIEAIFKGQNKFLVDNGIEVHIVTSPYLSTIEFSNSENIIHHPINIARGFSFSKDLKSILNLIFLIKRIKPDIVHTHTSKAGFIGMIAAKIANVRHLVHSVAGWPAYTRSKLQRQLILFCEKVSFTLADKLLVNSHSLNKYLNLIGFNYGDKLCVLGNGSSNGVDLNYFSPSNKVSRDLIRIKFKIAHKDIVIAYLGRIMIEKGISDLLNAFLTINNINTRLLLIGSFENDWRAKLDHKTIDILTNHPRIHITGWTNDVAIYLSAADILVHPSSHEGLSNALLQGSAMALPCIASKVTGNIDVVINDVTGFFYNNMDVSDLISKLLLLIDNEPLRIKMGANGRRFIAKLFDNMFVNKLLYSYYMNCLK